MINRFGGKYQFLSNMYPVTIEVRGHKYPSVEHAYQALKCANEDDRIAISVSRSPEEARRAGKCVVRKEGWKDSKIATLEEILLIKFLQIIHFRCTFFFNPIFYCCIFIFTKQKPRKPKSKSHNSIF